ncbi:MAG TPA: biopolymer transporter ExbD, partial [Spirochaetia bacterium]|nr:biopolymer transporter ExbD [Spirochaetia bacterium]
VLMLVIFFLVATVFRVGPGLALNLPQSTTAQNVSVTELRLTVVGADDVWLGATKTTLGKLDGLLKDQLKGKDLKTLRVVVEGGQDAPYQTVVSVLDVLRQNQVTGVNLMTKLAGPAK